MFDLSAAVRNSPVQLNLSLDVSAVALLLTCFTSAFLLLCKACEKLLPSTPVAEPSLFRAAGQAGQLRGLQT